MTVKHRAPTKKSQSSPEVAQKLVDIEQTLIRQNKFVEALAALMELATGNLQDAQVWLLVGLVYTRMAHWQNAISVLKTALQLDPANNSAKQLMSLALFSIGQKVEACKLIDAVCKSGSATGPQWMLRAYLHQHTSSDPMHSLAVARDWGKRFADPLTRAAKPLHVKNRDPRKRLKIGYVTADFREHSVAFFMQPVLAHHNPENVEVHVYSNGPSDAVTEQMRALVPHWHDIQDFSDESLSDLIRDHQIDILLDLSGYTHGHRLGVFARRSAPVQVTWLGYMHTLGMRAMDYRLIGSDAESENNEKANSEKMFYLRGMACYSPPTYSPICEISPCVNNGYVTLISMNSSGKITDYALSVWAEILIRKPNAKLIIMVKEDNADAAQLHMQPRIEKYHMPLDRVSVMPQLPLNRFMELGYIADIALDTFPISGGTTTLHALWMGMPIIAMDGERDVDASSARIIKSLGGGGLVCSDTTDYIEKTVNLIDDIKKINDYRRFNRKLLESSYLMNYLERTRGLENAFRVMWFNYISAGNNFKREEDFYKIGDFCE